MQSFRPTPKGGTHERVVLRDLKERDCAIVLRLRRVERIVPNGLSASTVLVRHALVAGVCVRRGSNPSLQNYGSEAARHCRSRVKVLITNRESAGLASSKPAML